MSSVSGYRLSAQAAERERRWSQSADHSSATPLSADRPAPTDVVDGRFWGDDQWSILSSLPSAATTPETAARVSAVYFCVSLIAEAFGSLQGSLVDENLKPISVPLSDVLWLEPNPLQVSSEFWACMAFCASLRGVAFAEPTVGIEQAEIWPLDPRKQSVDWGERHFTVDYHMDGKTRRLVPQQLFWISGISDAALKPLVPWQMAKGAIDFQLALEAGARSFFRNQQRFAGILSTEQKLTDEGLAHIKEGVARWKNGGIPVLEQGLSFKETQSTNTDSQLVELIKQRTLEMGRYWRIPRSMVGEEGGPAANQEQEAGQFVKYTMRPLARRAEQAITVRLLPPDMRAKGIRARFNLNSLLRGDSGTQFRNAVLARTAGTHSVDELRTDWFDMPAFNEDWSRDPRAPLNSNRAADTMTGGETSPQDKVGTDQ
ncbi:phage portal protein [Novosphingobium kaempferiae]|uniref:phage portal protein n=1 Tax=Novosphingobium kaempferiae TaxID=2896849 RepID=UPI001E4366DD|nr:phage portal protein [Novosphingobium kaempferiae]